MIDPIGLIVGFVVLAIIGGIIVHATDEARIQKSRKADENMHKTLSTKGDAVYDTIYGLIEMGRLPIHEGTVPLMLASNEFPILSTTVGLYGESVAGQYRRVSLPIGYGASYETGSAQFTTSLRIVDWGALTITTKRLVFIGKKKTTSVGLEAILGLQAFQESLVVNRSDQTNADIFFVGEARAISLIVTTLQTHQCTKVTNDTLRLLAPGGEP